MVGSEGERGEGEEERPGDLTGLGPQPLGRKMKQRPIRLPGLGPPLLLKDWETVLPPVLPPGIGDVTLFRLTEQPAKATGSISSCSPQLHSK